MPYYSSDQFRLCRSRLVVPVLLLLLVATAAFGAAADQQQPVRRQHIVAGICSNNGPYEYLYGGQPSGYNVEILQAAAAAMQLSLELHSGSRQELLQDMQHGRLDVLCSMHSAGKHDPQFVYTAAFAKVSHALYVRRDSALADFADLAGRQIAVVQGEMIQQYLHASGYRFNIIGVADPVQALQLVADGRYDAAIVPELQGAYLIDLFALNNLRRLDAKVPVQQLCFAVAPDDLQLRLLLDEGLRVIHADGSAALIHEKWFRLLEQRRFAPRLHLLTLVVPGVICLLLLSLLWSRSLRRQVRRKTLELRQELEQRRQVEEALLQSENSYREIFDAAGDAIFVHDGETGAVLDVNRKVYELFGFTVAEFRRITADHFSEAVPPYTASDALAWIRRAAAGEPQLFEWHAKRKDNSLFWVEVSLRRATIGGCQCVLAVVRDISKRKHDELALHRLVTAIEQTADIIMITDLVGQIVYVNPAFVQVTGYDCQYALGKNPRFLQSGKQERQFYEQMWQTIAAGQIWKGRLINRKKNAELYTEECSVSPVRDDHGRIINYVAVKRDITCQLALEAQLRQAQKMEVLGQLASGIAHDFNNLLLPILGYSDLNLLQIDQDQPLYADLQEIRDAAQRAQALTRQLLAFSRKHSVEMLPLMLNEVVRNFSNFLRRLLGESIRLEMNLADDLHQVEADRTQVEQIVMNLVVNARDAMPGGGVITLSTANVEVAPAVAVLNNGLPSGSYVAMRVADTGHGMDEQTRAKAFDPFFTTKVECSGTGLGLSTTLGIVQEHHGYIKVESELGQGTTFTLYLPRLTDVDLLQIAESDDDTVGAGNGQTVMIVEDEESIRKLIVRMLSSQGYRLLDFGSVEAAMAGAQAVTIDLLITDVVMPGMNGIELYKHLSQRQKNLRVLYISGYAMKNLAAYGLHDADIDFLQKPFTLPSLLKKVNELLAGLNLAPLSR